MADERLTASDVLYIVMPAYNEAGNIASVVEGWYPIVAEHDGGGLSRMLVVDDGSSDDTYGILLALAEDRPLLISRRKPNCGHGPTVLHGYSSALDAGADYVFQTDSDGQTDPAEFEAFWSMRHDYDAIIGNRADREDGMARAFVSHVVCVMVRLFFGVRVPDANTPFRLMSAGYVRDTMQWIPKDYFLPNVVLTAIGVKSGKRVAFKEVTFRPRQGGVNSLSLWRIAKVGVKSIRDFAQIRRNFERSTG